MPGQSGLYCCTPLLVKWPPRGYHCWCKLESLEATLICAGDQIGAQLGVRKMTQHHLSFPLLSITFCAKCSLARPKDLVQCMEKHLVQCMKKSKSIYPINLQSSLEQTFGRSKHTIAIYPFPVDKEQGIVGETVCSLLYCLLQSGSGCFSCFHPKEERELHFFNFRESIRLGFLNHQTRIMFVYSLNTLYKIYINQRTIKQ